MLDPLCHSPQPDWSAWSIGGPEAPKHIMFEGGKKNWVEMMDKGGIPDAFPNLKNFPQLKHIETSSNHATSNKSRHFLSDGLMHHIVISPEAVAQFWIRGTEKLPYPLHSILSIWQIWILELSWAVLISSSVLSGTSENLAGSLCLPICKTKRKPAMPYGSNFPACKINGTSNFIVLPLRLCERNDMHFLWYSMCIDVHAYILESISDC